MARSTNTVTLEGNVTRDPELRVTNGGITVADVGIAVTYSRKQGNEWVDEANFFNITAFADLAEHIGESINKGDRIVVSGRLAQSNWEDKEGNKRSKVEIIAETLAASLTYATVTIERVQRSNDN